MMRSLLLPAFATCSALLLGAVSASAQSGKGQQGAAEALFEQATSLVDAGRIAEACEKFAASQELDPGLGTQLHLADCYDRAGRSASSWALFREVEERSHREGQTDRERIAAERASSLESKLSRLELRVQPARQLTGLTLALAGAAVPKASWNVALPVDPGKLRLEVTAPGRRPWSTQIEVPSGPSTRVVDVPLLALAPTSAPPPASTPQGSDRSDGSARRTLGLLTGGVGLAALAAGGILGYRAYSFNQRSKGECRAESPNACTPEGASLREQATGAAQLSTIATISGAVLVVGGVTLVLTAPSPLAEARRNQAAQRDSGWQLQMAGVW